jgi:hypothetical protein
VYEGSAAILSAFPLSLLFSNCAFSAPNAHVDLGVCGHKAALQSSEYSPSFASFHTGLEFLAIMQLHANFSEYGLFELY